MKLMTTAIALMMALNSFAQKTVQEKLKFMNANVEKVTAVFIDGVSQETDKKGMIRFTEKGFTVKYKGVDKKYLWKDVTDLEDKSVIDQVVLYFPGKNKDDDEEEEEVMFMIYNEVARDYYDYMKALLVHNNNIIED